MRICFVTTTPASSIGGVENVVSNIMEQAKKEGFNVENIFAYQKYKTPINSLNAFRNVEKKIKKGNFDFIHSHDNASYNFARNRSLPIIHTSHGTWGNYFSAMKMKKGLFGINKIISKSNIKMERFIVKTSDINTAVSNFVKKSLQEQYDVESEVIHNGVDVDKFSISKKRNEVPVGIWVGTNPELKGLDMAIKTVKTLNLHLIVVGLNAKNDSNTTYLGRVVPDKMPDVYKKADFLIFPSKYESHPIVPLEAMAAGLPIIVSEQSNVEIIKNGKEGFIVNGDEDSYTVAIQKTLRKYKIMSKAARSCAERFSWKSQAKKYFKLYEKHESV